MTVRSEGRAQAVLITPIAPAGHGNGLAMRAELLRAGLSTSFDIKVIVVDGPGASDPRTDVIRRLQLPRGAERIRRAHPLPSLAVRATATRAIAIAQTLRNTDLVVVFRTYLVPLLDAILAEPSRPPIVLDVDDIESVFHRAIGDSEQAERFERLEAHYLPLIDAVLTCSAEDAEMLGRRLDLQRVEVVPNAVRVPEALVSSANPEYDLLFVGNLGYRPNIDGIRWLLGEVLPRLPGVRVALVGSRPVPEVRALARDAGVRLAPDVPDVGPWYAKAHIAVVPLLHGGGSRIKAIEALAHGLPEVATTTGAAGLPWSAARSPVVIADDPDGFANGCRELLSDPSRARRLADAGRELVRAHASVAVVGAQIDRLGTSMVRR